MSKMNKRYYCVEIILYTDNSVHIELLRDLIKKYDYAYILHDKDKEDNGTFKKPHYHLLIFFPNARWGSSILKEIKIDNSNLIEFRDNKVAAIQYLLHSNNLDKYQYPIEDIISNIDINIYFNNLKNREEQDVAIIYDFILNYKGILYFIQLYNFCVSNNLWPSYRRNYSIIKDVLIEHNREVSV